MNGLPTQNAPTGIPAERIEAALEASYEIEALTCNFPETLDDPSLVYLQRLFIKRMKVLSRVVMSALTDDRETRELREIVGLKNAEDIAND